MVERAETETRRGPHGEPVSRETGDLLSERAEQLMQVVPEAFAEGSLDFEKLRAALGDFVEECPERYSFSWAGKRDAIRTLQAPSRATLVPVKGESMNFDTTEHLFIEGENLEVLKLLYRPYFGRVKMIYIDPPYNTGNDFIYPDDFADPLDSYLRITGQKDGDGNLLTTNPETGGRYHSTWLSMMYPRLFLARQLLREDGVIFVSIDDHEVHNLRMLMNEVFGEENFVAQIIWEKMYTTKNDASQISVSHEYVICFAANANKCDINLLPRTSDMDARYRNPDNDPRGPWKPIPLYAEGERKGGRYPIKGPTGRSFEPAPNKHWRYRKEDVLGLIQDSRVYFGEDGASQPNLKRFLSEVQQGVKTRTIWDHTDVGSNDSAKRELRVLFPDQEEVPFSYPKPSTLLAQMLKLSTQANEGDVILDFFAGSCASAQAVLSLNREDGGSRRFIMVQLPEPVAADSAAGKAGYRTIADVGKERIRRVIARLEEERRGQLDLAVRESPEDLGFKVFKLAPSNYRPWTDLPVESTKSYLEQLAMFSDPLVEGWVAGNVIYEVALKEGFGLNCRIEKVEGVDSNVFVRVLDPDRDQSFYVCLDEVVRLEGLRSLGLAEEDLFVCRDSALDDETAANLALQCRLKTI